MDDADDWLLPRGTVAGLAFSYDAYVQGLPVSAEQLLLNERTAAALGVDREALLREAPAVVGPLPSSAMKARTSR